MQEILCKGDWALGTACGECSRCRATSLTGAVDLLRRNRALVSEFAAVNVRLQHSEKQVDRLELALHRIVGHGNITVEKAKVVAAAALKVAAEQ